MKTLTAILLASGLAILSTLSVSAQEQTPRQPNWVMAINKLDCTTVEDMTARILDKYGEQPFAQGDVLTQMFHPQYRQWMFQEGQMLMAVNAETKSYSLIGIFNAGTPTETACLLAIGKGFAPASIGEKL